ncbi:MAG: hypothetical protein ABIS28_14550 [Caldimonas sp.]
MNIHPSIPTTLRRPAAWPAWPRRGGTGRATNEGRWQPRASQRHVDWPLLAFWVGYLTIFGGSVWLFVP